MSAMTALGLQYLRNLKDLLGINLKILKYEMVVFQCRLNFYILFEWQFTGFYDKSPSVAIFDLIVLNLMQDKKTVHSQVFLVYNKLGLRLGSARI